MKNVLITGATSGFGEAIARKLAGLKTCRLILTGRRNERLVSLSEELKKQYGTEVITLNFDVRDKTACEKGVAAIPTAFHPVDILVNNAGLAAGAMPFDQSDPDDFERMIDTNIKGLIYMTQLIIPEMKEAGSGQIINLSSVAGVDVYPNGNVYCATKHAVNALTKALRIDLLPYGIRVGSVSPGAAETEFSIVRYHGDTDKAKAVYKGIVPLSADDIADAVEFMVTRPPHVSINDILITPTQQANAYVFHRKE